MSKHLDPDISINAVRDGDTWINDRGQLVTAMAINHDGVNQNNNGHHTVHQGDEYVCLICNRRWDVDDTDIPPCE